MNSYTQRMVLTNKIFIGQCTKTVSTKLVTLSTETKKKTKGLLKRNNKKGKLKKSKQDKLNNALINSVPVTFNILLNHVLKKLNINVDQAIKDVQLFHNDLIKNHSVVEGTARFNSIRLYAIRLLEGQNPDPLDRVAIGRKDRWPSKLDKLRPLFYRVRDEQCPISDRVIRSILYLNRLCTGNGVPDFSEIEKAYTVSESVRDQYRSHLDKRVTVFRGELITKPSTRVLSNGPNGKPKWLTADLEAYTLMRSELHDHFKSLCIATGNFDLYEYMESRANSLTRVDRARLRYITTVRDSGNKCRLVAISDYWTQVLLEPIMLDVQQYIKHKFGIVSYSTDHSKGFNYLQRYLKVGTASYDVTSWTDAFPAVLQHDFMVARYGKPIADAWYNLVVSCKWNIKGSKDTIEYNRGQGMGTNGSFDIATATDLHFIEMVYARDYGKARLSRDLLGKVGDDLWCQDPSGHVLNAYTNELGISINMSKTKQATKENLCGEFVSRSINNGRDVSRISANICRSVGKNILDLPQLAYHLNERGYESIIPIKEIFLKLKIKEGHQRKVLRAFYLLCLLHPRQGLDLLKKSIEVEFQDLFEQDTVLYILNVLGVAALKRSFEAWCVLALLESIQAKLADIIDATVEFDSSQALSETSDADKYWLLREPIGLLTSKVILARSWRSVQEMYSAPEFSSVTSILETLSKTDQQVTFKELGVISSDSTPWRPKATKVYNYSNSITAPSNVSKDSVFANLKGFGSESLFITTNTDVQAIIDEPIFGDTFRSKPHLGPTQHANDD